MSDRRLSCQSTAESAAPDDANPQTVVECDNIDNTRSPLSPLHHHHHEQERSPPQKLTALSDPVLPIAALHVNRNVRPAIANTPHSPSSPPMQDVPSYVGRLGAGEGEQDASMPIQKKPALFIDIAPGEDQVFGERGDAGGRNGEEEGKGGQQGTNAFHRTLSVASVDHVRLGEGEVDPAVSRSLSAPPPAQLASRRRPKRRAHRGVTSSGVTSSSKKGSRVEEFSKLFKETFYSPSVSSFTGLMTAFSVFVSIAIMLGTVGIVSSPVLSSSRTRGGSLGSEFLPNSSVAREKSVKLHAVGVAALKPLGDALRGLDEVQEFAMQRRETDLLLDVIGTGGWAELKHTPQPSRIYAPTADASALLPLGPFVNKLSSQLLAHLHNQGKDAAHYSSTLSTASTGGSGISNLPHISLGFEDGRYVHVGSYKAIDALVISVLDGNVKSTSLSGNYNGTFPLVDKSLDRSMVNDFAPVINATPTDIGNSTRPYYSYGSWKIADEGTAQEIKDSPWVNRPYVVDTANMSAVYRSILPGNLSQISQKVMGKVVLWSDVVFARNSPWYASARNGKAPLQKNAFGLYGLQSVSRDPDGYALTFAAPVYIRRTSLFNTTGDPNDPIGGHQRSQVTYSSPSAGAAIESFINERYVFVGVAATHLVLGGLSDHLASVVDSVWSSTSDPSANKGQLFLLRRATVWATSLRQEDGTLTSVYTAGPNAAPGLVDEDGVSLCTGSPGAYTCMHSIHTFGSDLLSRAYTVLPTIANPPPLLVSDKEGSAADRVRDLVQSSSTTELVMSNDLNEASTFTDSEGAAWDVSYAIVSQPSTGLRPFSGPQMTPFVLVLVTPADPPITCKEVLGLKLGLLVGVGVAILVVLAVAVMFLSHLVLSPLRSIATQMSMSAHLIDSSTDSSSVDEKVKLADRTPSRWAEVSAIQKAYWSMGEELQALAAYIPEHLRDEVLAMKARGRGKPSMRTTTAEASREEAPPGGMDPAEIRTEFPAFSSVCEDADEIARGDVNVLKGPPQAPRLTKAALQAASSEKETKASPQSRSAGSELSVGGRGLAAHSIVSLGVVFENHQETATEASSEAASTSPDVPRPVFFIDSALIDREITVVHFNILHFHWHAADTHSRKLASHYDEFISFVHQEARRHGGMLESFSGDKIWVSFNASSKCTNGPVAAAYYAHTVTTAVNNEVIRKGATDSKARDHPISSSARRLTKEFEIAPFGITCGVATGPAYVGPLGNASVKRHTIISNAMSEATALERLALWYPGCNALIGGDMIPAVEGYCQYVLIEASLLPGSNNKRRRVACLKGPMVASGKDPAVVARLADGTLPEMNPYSTLNQAMNAFLEGRVDMCRQLLIVVEEECSAAARDAKRTWEGEERAACTKTIARVISANLERGVDGRTYCSDNGGAYATVTHSLCFFRFR